MNLELENTITDKEYLTFCDATNLDWHFNPLDKVTEGNVIRPQKLNELLSPDKFERKDKEGNFLGYPYMSSVKSRDAVTPEDKKEGIKEMRKKAPTVMNYLKEVDNNKNEGNFLKEWEVVYGADNYEIVKESLKMNKEYMKVQVEEIDKHLNNKATILRQMTSDPSVVLNISDMWNTSILTRFENCTIISDKAFIESLKNDEDIDAEIRNQMTKIKKYIEDIKFEIESREKINKDFKCYSRIDLAITASSFLLSGISYKTYFASSRQANVSNLDIKGTMKKLAEGLKKGTHPEVKAEIKKSLKALGKNITPEDSDYIVSFFLGLLIGNAIGSIFNKVSNKMDKVLSVVGNIFISCFTRFTGFDVINTSISQIGEAFKEEYAKSLTKSLYGSGNVLIEEEMPTYDTGFRFLILKSEAHGKIIAVYKGDKDRGDGILPLGMSRVRVCYEKVKEIKKQNKNMEIEIIGQGGGAEIALLNKLLYDENLISKTNIFTNTAVFAKIKKSLDFDIEYFGKVGYVDDLYVSITGDLAGASTSCALGYLYSHLNLKDLLKKIPKLEGALSKVSKVTSAVNKSPKLNFEPIKNMWKGMGNTIKSGLTYAGLGEINLVAGAAMGYLLTAIILAAVTTILFHMIKKIIDTKTAITMNKELKRLGYVSQSPVKGIENYISAEAIKYRELRVIGYSKISNIKVDRVLLFYLITEKKLMPDNMEIMDENGKPLCEINGKVYHINDIGMSRNPKPAYSNLPDTIIIMVDKNNNKNKGYYGEVSHSYFKLKKENNIYYPVDSWIKTTPNLSTPQSKHNFDEFKTSKSYYIFSAIEIASKLQNAYINNIETIKILLLSNPPKKGNLKEIKQHIKNYS